MNGFPPPSGLSFPSNGVGFAPSYVGVGSYSGPPNSAVPIPDAMPSNDALPQSDTYPWMPPRGVPAQLVRYESSGDQEQWRRDELTMDKSI